MQYAAALALASLSGKVPTKDLVAAILKATGKPVDDAQVDAVIASLSGRAVNDVISAGIGKVGSLGAAKGGAPAPAPKEDKKDSKPKKEEAPAPAEEEEEGDFGLDLFG